MAVCDFCNQEMKVADGCSIEVFDDFADGARRTRIRYGEEFVDYTWTWRCHDCNAKPGEFHHPGCDMEVCPRCGGQAFACDCVDSDEPVRAWEPQRWPWFCDDCGVDCAGIRENYMVADELWPPHASKLCVACLEHRLGRTLTRDDFMLGAHWQERELSARLRRRLAS